MTDPKPMDGRVEQYMHDNTPPPERLRPHEGSLFAPRGDQDSSSGAWKHPHTPTAMPGWSHIGLAVLVALGGAFWWWVVK